LQRQTGDDGGQAERGRKAEAEAKCPALLGGQAVALDAQVGVHPGGEPLSCFIHGTVKVAVDRGMLIDETAYRWLSLPA
jgi:hypothetical protein